MMPTENEPEKKRKRTKPYDPPNSQRVLVAVNGPITLNGPGGYSVIARLGDSELARTSFRAVLQ